MLPSEFLELLSRPPLADTTELAPSNRTDLAAAIEARWPATLRPALAVMAEQALARPHLVGRCDGTPAGVRQLVETIRAEIDLLLSTQINLILHHPEFQALESSWRGLHFLVRNTATDEQLKIKLFDIPQRELARTLRKFRGTGWDQSPIFKKIYEEEYGQFGGEPFGVLVGDYYFDHQPQHVQLLSDIAAIAAAAHVPFIAGAAPSLMQMDSWAELANPRDLIKLFQTPEYASWRALRASEDSRYLGLCMPRMLTRVPYGMRTDPLDNFAFEEDVEGPDACRYAWTNAAFAMAGNIARSFAQYGWCSRIHGIETGGIVEDLPVLRFPTADGEVDNRCCTEIALDERRESELARLGLIPLMHRKNTDTAAFISACSLQKPVEYDDPEATTNAIMSARLPYIFSCCRFAHYLKCIVRDKVGSNLSRDRLQAWLNEWVNDYVDHSPGTSDETWKATHPLAAARITLAEAPDKPGHYDARFFLLPHYQLEGLTVALRLVSRVAT